MLPCCNIMSRSGPPCIWCLDSEEEEHYPTTLLLLEFAANGMVTWQVLLLMVLREFCLLT